MSQVTHFCGVKFLVCKSSSVKFWTNIMSAGRGGARALHIIRMSAD